MTVPEAIRQLRQALVKEGDKSADRVLNELALNVLEKTIEGYRECVGALERRSV